jgi:calcium-dependent protein kinase
METFEYQHSLYLVMEICSGGDLYSRDPYNETDSARISQSILNAVSYMHQQGISHRDLKYENIMFTSPQPNADVKIIDFGLSKKYGMSGKAVMHDAVGTIYSMSPEVLLGTYTNKADVWSCGVLTFMLLSSTMPFYGKNRKHVMKRILKGQFAFKGPKWRSVLKNAKNFVVSLLKYAAADRPTAAQATRDPWLRTMYHSRQSSISQIPETMDAVQASIENFAKYSTLKKLALMVVAHRSTSDEIGFLRRVFRKYDDQEGLVTLEGFKAALSDYMYSDEELEAMFKGIDVDGSGQVQYFEFLAASIEAHGYINEERLAEAFDRLDSDDSGSISVRDLREFLGSEVSDEYLDKIIEEDDITKDRIIDYDEFLQMWSMGSDSERLKTLETVVQRRYNQTSSRQSSFGGTDSDETGKDTEMSGLTSSGDELDDEVGDALFERRKHMSIRASSMSLSKSPKPDVQETRTADI